MIIIIIIMIVIIIIMMMYIYWSGTEGGAINGGVPPGSCYFGPWKTTPQWRAFVLLACE